MDRHNVLRPLVLGLVAAAGIAGSASALPVVYTAALSGAAESPPTASTGTGFSIVTIDTDADTLRVQVSFAGLISNSTVAHIHCCTAVPFAGTVTVATTTPSFPGFPAGVTSGTYDQTFDLSQASTYRPGFITDNGGSPATAEAALAAGLASGRAYVNVHSVLFAAGEIRGFLAEVPAPATLALLGTALAGLRLARRRRNG